jgi:hypothetical protein
MSWTDNGPVSVPPQTVVYGAALVVALAALGGVGVGFRAGWRDAGRPALGAGDQTQGADSAIIAKPIVDIGAIEQQAPPDTSNAASPAVEAAQATNDIAVKTAAAQAAQSRPSQGAVNIDDIVASSSEKPQAPAKPTTDEQAPKSDVPF